MQVEAAEEDATFELHPHCRVNPAKDDDWIFGPIPAPGIVVETRDGSVRCRNFEVLDPQTLQTPELEVGDVLDIDLVVENPSEQDISRVRAWLSYDPTMLEGQLLEINEAYDVVTPDEQDFYPNEGYAKMEGFADSNAPDDKKIVFARLQFRVLQTNNIGTPITFHDVSPDGHGGIYVTEGEAAAYVVGSQPGDLLVRFSGEPDPIPDPSPDSGANPFEEDPKPEPEPEAEPEAPRANGEACAQNAQCQSNLCVSGLCVPAIDNSAQANVGEERTAFSLLQVRNLRVTTDGSAAFLAWDHLRSSQLQAYNVYYGTISGQYINRHTVNKNENSLTLRSLPANKRYFFAVRALSNDDEESEWSQEVSVLIGDPFSSTAPLAIGSSGQMQTTNPVGNGPGTFPGETGASSWIALFVLIVASVGTALALRRQTIALTNTPHE